MSLLAVVNPSRRRRRHKKSARRASKRVRRMTAKQLKYFGPRAGRVVRRRARRRARTFTVAARPNPVRRRSRRSLRRSARRSFRRNPIGGVQMRASLGQVQRSLMGAANGAAGAIVVDMAMAQAAKFLPDTVTSRFAADTGGLNFGYYGVKAALALALGIAGTRFLPGRMKSFAAKGVEGALTIQAYEIARGLIPASIVLGYMSPGRGAGMAAYLRGARRRGGMGAYLPNRAAQPMGGRPSFSEPRVGEGSVL